MNNRSIESIHSRKLELLGIALSAFLLPACGGAVQPGVSVGRVGHDLGARSQTVPQGVEACALKEALAAQAGAPEKAMTDSCAKAMTSDALWRRAMVVLGAYANTLDSVASGNASDTAGQIEAAQTGVAGKDWIQVEGAEQGARDAVAQIVEQLRNNTAKDDLEKRVNEAAPHVKTVCGGLTSYLDEQARSLAEVATEADKRRVARTDRRCTTLDNRSICVSDSATDRVVYAHTFGQLATLVASHVEARNAVDAFCAAHAKLADASANGKLSDDATQGSIAEAVKSAQRPPPAADSPGSAPSPAPTPKK